MDWVLGVLVLLGLVAIRIFLRRWLARRWLAGRITINQMAAAIVLTGGAGIGALVFGWSVLIRGAPLWVLLIPAVVSLLLFPFARWALISFMPAPGSGDTNAPSLLEDATLRRIHRDPE